MKTWEGIEEFVSVVRFGSMTAAAHELNLSVASISRRLNSLEQRLGLVLLRRSTRRQSLTPAGEILFTQASAMLEQLQTIVDEMSGQQQELRGPIRISSASGYVIEFLGPKLASFAMTHPAVSLELQVATRIVDLVTEPFDLAIRHGHLRDSGLTARRLFQRRLVMCASPLYIHNHGRPTSPDELHAHECLLGFSDRWSLLIDGRVRKQRIDGRWRSNNGTALLAAARAGIGILPTRNTGSRRPRKRSARGVHAGICNVRHSGVGRLSCQP